MILTLASLATILSIIGGWFSCTENYQIAWNFSQSAYILCGIALLLQINRTIDIIKKLKP